MPPVSSQTSLKFHPYKRVKFVIGCCATLTKAYSGARSIMHVYVWKTKIKVILIEIVLKGDDLPWVFY